MDALINNAFGWNKSSPVFPWVKDMSMNGGSGTWRPLTSDDFSATLSGDIGDIVLNTDELEGLMRTGNFSSAPDLNTSFAYSDLGTSEERVASISYSSSAWGISLTDTFLYGGSSGSYYVTGISRG
jgi:hypothetical protein